MLLTAYVVNSLADTVAADGELTLREAVQASTEDRPVNEAPAGAGADEVDIIEFAPALAGQSMELSLGTLNIRGATEIHFSNVQVSPAIENDDLLFSVHHHSDVVITDLRIDAKGRAEGISNGGTLRLACCEIESCIGDYCGGIYNRGRLSVSDSSFVYCKAGRGAGIYNGGTLSVSGSCFLGCTGDRGGGIYSGGPLSVSDSSFEYCMAEYGGGVYNAGDWEGPLVVNSYFKSNSAGIEGGALYNSGDLTVANTYVYWNAAEGEGGGVFSAGQTTLTNLALRSNTASIGGAIGGEGVTLTNSVLDRNEAEEWPDVNSTGLVYASHNFIAAEDGDPMLMYLSDSEHPVFTSVPRPEPGSPLIDAGANVFAVDAEGRTLQTDMEGNPRIYNDKVDIGPTEFVGSIISDRWLFYNNSLFDGFDSSANAADDSAIDWTKMALLPGAAPTPANYTGYASGLNGVMLNVAGLSADATLSEDDFDFHVGYLDDWTSWVTAPAPESITVRGHDGLDGARVSIVWADNAIENKWLRVRVKATWNTMLPKDDVFYFASVPGDANGDGNVDLADFGVLKGNFGKVTLAVDGGDFNLSGYVTLDDFVALKTNFGATLSAPPAAPVAMTNTLITAEPEDVHTDSEPARRTSRGVRSLVRGRTGSIARRRIAEQLGRPTNVFDLLAEANAPSLR